MCVCLSPHKSWYLPTLWMAPFQVRHCSSDFKSLYAPPTHAAASGCSVGIPGAKKPAASLFSRPFGLEPGSSGLCSVKQEQQEPVLGAKPLSKTHSNGVLSPFLSSTPLGPQPVRSGCSNSNRWILGGPARNPLVPMIWPDGRHRIFAAQWPHPLRLHQELSGALHFIKEGPKKTMIAPAMGTPCTHPALT